MQELNKLEALKSKSNRAVLGQAPPEVRRPLVPPRHSEGHNDVDRWTGRY
jgi:hypothetical protein